mgnify:CR=1 FL=1
MTSAPFAAYCGRLIFDAVLITRSPLHVGSGFSDGHLTQSSGESKAEGEIANVVLGLDDLPVIPATSIKGAMRALIEQSDQDAAKALFGDIKSDGGGRMGVLTPYAATTRQKADVGKRIDRKSEDRGVFIAQRVAIDDASGTAADKKLLTRTMVAPGHSFNLQMVVMGGDAVLEPPHRDILVKLLASIRERHLQLGSGKGDGHGVLAFKLERVRSLSLNRTTGALDEQDVTSVWTKAIEGTGKPELINGFSYRYRLQLAGEDVFAVLGAREEPKAKTEQQPALEKGRGNTLKALRNNDGTPELPGTSLMGVLRARAEWLVELKRARFTPGEEDAILLAELFGAEADALKNIKPRLAKRNGIKPGNLTGFAGMLRVISIKAKGGNIVTTPSVRIDRLAQAPMDGGLFAFEAFDQPTFEVELGLDHRAKDCHAEFVEALLKDIIAEGPRQGLMLGHRGNSGFGWVAVTRNETVPGGAS